MTAIRDEIRAGGPGARESSPADSPPCTSPRGKRLSDITYHMSIREDTA